MILIADVFHVSNDTTYIAGIKRINFNCSFPAIFELNIESIPKMEIKIEGFIFTNNYYVDEYFDKITIWTKGHLDKLLFENKNDAYLRFIKNK